MKFKSDGNETWAISQELEKLDNELSVELNFYLKGDHHHFF